MLSLTLVLNVTGLFGRTVMGETIPTAGMVESSVVVVVEVVVVVVEVVAMVVAVVDVVVVA